MQLMTIAVDKDYTPELETAAHNDILSETFACSRK